MKGRTKCPECKHEFVMDVPDTDEKHEAVCPECETKFTIKTKFSSEKCKEGECFWEEYGEPRKTILSSIKPHTKKPQLVALILICVFIIGLSTALFSEKFIETNMDFASSLGLKGSVEFNVINQTNQSINNANILIDNNEFEKTGDGMYHAEDIELGIKKVKISSPKYGNLSKEILITPFFTSSYKIKMNEGKNNIINEYDSSGCAIILIIFSVFGLIGAIACIQRKHIDLAIAGSLISIFSFGFFFIASILSIIAFVLIMKSREEFNDGKKGKFF